MLPTSWLVRHPWNWAKAIALNEALSEKRPQNRTVNVWEELMSNYFNNKLTHAYNKIVSQKIEWDQPYAKSNQCSEVRINNYVLGTRWLEEITDILNYSGLQRQFNIMLLNLHKNMRSCSSTKIIPCTWNIINSCIFIMPIYHHSWVKLFTYIYSYKIYNWLSYLLTEEIIFKI